MASIAPQLRQQDFPNFGRHFPAHHFPAYPLNGAFLVNHSIAFAEASYTGPVQHAQNVTERTFNPHWQNRPHKHEIKFL
jgi:hypothetical protein